MLSHRSSLRLPHSQLLVCLLACHTFVCTLADSAHMQTVTQPYALFLFLLEARFKVNGESHRNHMEHFHVGASNFRVACYGKQSVGCPPEYSSTDWTTWKAAERLQGPEDQTDQLQTPSSWESPGLHQGTLDFISFQSTTAFLPHCLVQEIWSTYNKYDQNVLPLPGPLP